MLDLPHEERLRLDAAARDAHQQQRVASPYRADALAILGDGHKDLEFAIKCICEGSTTGAILTSDLIADGNHPSVGDHADAVQQYLRAELEDGHLAGPFDSAE